MKTKRILLVGLALMGLAFTLANNWIVDSKKAQVEFIVNGPFGEVNGHFSGLRSTINFDENNLSASTILASVDVMTIETGNRLRNEHLREKAEWFNAAKYEQITIKSRQIRKTGEGYQLTADLTIKGITKSVDIPFSFTLKDNSGEFKSQFKINREDFGVGNSGGGVGNVVTIRLDIPVSR